MAAVCIPNFNKAILTTARNQTLVNEGQTVCALERYHLAHGEYPEALDALVPQFIEKLPHDIIGSPPVQLRRGKPAIALSAHKRWKVSALFGWLERNG